MSNNKKKNNKQNNLPFSNEVKEMKCTFKKMIDEMSDEEFIDLVSFLMFTSDCIEDEEWENEAEKFYGKNSNSSDFSITDDDKLPF